MKKNRAIKNLLIDLVCACAAMMVFALFHHVLPRTGQSLEIVIPQPSVSEQVDSSASTDPAQESMPFAPAKVKDTFSGTARAGKQGGKGKTGKGMNEKGGSALSGTTDVSTAETLTVPISEKFADKYSDTVITTENSYSSPDISITVTENTQGRATYYLADIYVRNIECLRSALAMDTYGSGFRDSIADMAALNNALLAINGDYYGNTNEGVVIRNGVIYRANPTTCDVCVLYYDGTMRVMSGASFSVDEAIQEGAWQAWTFGPALLDTDGSALTSFASTGRIISANPRTAIGYYEPGHYCMVVVDGRGESQGMTLQELSQLFSDLGCKAAYNLDGGNSSVMVWNNAVLNNPSGGGRESSDALLITEVKNYD
ncbi:MAG: phosphodiester glycosidase family protein [Clostridiales bacterium]|nr:phosphodiester glycosidase family protein [Clostridiales bacterium]